jgi:hypothetical protein
MITTTLWSWPTRLGYLAFLWIVLALLTWLVVGRVLPHFLDIPFVGGLVALFMTTVFVSMYLAAIQMTRAVVSGQYPEVQAPLAAPDQPR